MRRAIWYLAAGISVVLLAKKFTPSFIRDLKQQRM
jgi:hypothetical protein